MCSYCKIHNIVYNSINGCPGCNLDNAAKAAELETIKTGVRGWLKKMARKDRSGQVQALDDGALVDLVEVVDK